MSVVVLWSKIMPSKLLASVSSKVIAWLALIATIGAIIGAMTLFDNKYASAADVNKTQAEMYKSIKLLSIDIQLQGLKNRRLELKGEKRNLQAQVAIYPNNITLKSMLEEVILDLQSVQHSIGSLENSRVIE